MATTIVMPQLGETVHEGTVHRWLKQVGERVEKFEPLLEVSTDKVNAEVTSTAGGVLAQILVPEGEAITVGSPIALIDETGAGFGVAPPAVQAPTAAPISDAPPPPAALTSTHAAPSLVGPAGPPQPVISGASVTAVAPNAVAITAADAASAPLARVDGVRYSPAVRRLAAEHQVDLATVRGTGLAGRVTRDDVLAHIAARPAPTPTSLAPAELPTVAVQPVAPMPAPATSGSQTAAAGDTRLPLTPMRRSIAEHMVRSKATSPHATTIMEIDMQAVHLYRLSSQAAFKAREGFELTYLPFVAKAVCEALRRYPTLNAVWGGDHILVKRAINLGIAVAIEPDGLLVPVIPDCDSLSITGIARAIRDLATRARAGKLTLADLQGGTFTVNNPGTFGTLISTPIINQPQAAIFSMEGIHRRLVVQNDDSIAVRPIMNAILAIDHRINDGMIAARFLAAVRDWLQGYQAGSGM